MVQFDIVQLFDEVLYIMKLYLKENLDIIQLILMIVHLMIEVIVLLDLSKIYL